jgi:hypothetical protein
LKRHQKCWWVSKFNPGVEIRCCDTPTMDVELARLFSLYSAEIPYDYDPSWFARAEKSTRGKFAAPVFWR